MDMFMLDPKINRLGAGIEFRHLSEESLFFVTDQGVLYFESE